jgi:uncharacterized protein (TIGR01777 family)
MRVLVTGATGLIGARLVRRLSERGDEVTVLSRDPARAAERLGGVAAERWDLMSEPAPAQALEGRDAIVHLAGEPVAQRWTESSRRAMRDSRIVGTGNLVAGMRAAVAAPGVLVSSSAVGFYGDRGDERLDESAAAGTGFLAEMCQAWETAAGRAGELGARVACVRTGIVLDRHGGALAKMLAPFRLGVGGPVAGGRQYMPWIHIDDLVDLFVAALDDERYTGPLNGSAPEPVTNAQFSRALGRALHRPAVMPVPALALRLLYGEMAQIVLEGQRAVPARALELGHAFAHDDLDQALRSALGR